MKSRQRLIGAITGKPIDRVPFSPFLAYYWESLPEETRRMGQFAYMREMGADPLLRGFYAPYKKVLRRCERRETAKGRERFVTYDTPVGSLHERYVYSGGGDTTFLVDHPVSTEEDLKVLSYIYENMEIVPDEKPFVEEFNRLGDEALILPLIGADMKTAFQAMVEHWLGTVNLAYTLSDAPEAVEDCLSVMRERDDETVTIGLNTPADGFIFWEDSSTTNISPDYFRRYTMPEINRWGDRLHAQGRFLVHHACGHLKDLLPLMKDMSIDAVESITPPPTGNVTAAEAAKVLPERIALIGGLDPVRLLSGSMEEVEKDAAALLDAMAGRRFVLANADSCPPGVEYEKFLLLSRMAKERVISPA